MGFPLHSYLDRTDNKLYRLQTPQSPIVRPYMYDHYNMDNYPIGTNAIVAVISYTGYDMEDAMVRDRLLFIVIEWILDYSIYPCLIKRHFHAKVMGPGLGLQVTSIFMINKHRMM